MLPATGLTYFIARWSKRADMTERPILFSVPMVRALLDGTLILRADRRANRLLRQVRWIESSDIAVNSRFAVGNSCIKCCFRFFVRMRRYRQRQYCFSRVRAVVPCHANLWRKALHFERRSVQLKTLVKGELMRHESLL